MDHPPSESRPAARPPRSDLPTAQSANRASMHSTHQDQNGRRPIGDLRELFWQNVIREMLTSLSMLSMQQETEASAEKHAPGTIIIDTPEGTITSGSDPQNDEPAEEDANEPSRADLFDGRLAVITTQGTRIPIAQVHPLFACGVTDNREDRSLSTAVECSVFQISTPPGEVYTLPLSEIRGFHSLSPKLVEKMKREAEAQMKRAQRSRGETDQPFGFAAFTSLARGEHEEDENAPDEQQPAAAESDDEDRNGDTGENSEQNPTD